MGVLEKFTYRTGYMESTTKRSIFGGDLNLLYTNRNGHAEISRGTQVFLNRLVEENGYTQAVNNPTQWDALLDVYLFRPESLFTSCSNVRGINNHCGVLLEVGGEEIAVNIK
jgi:hypothetical protein